MGMQLPDWVRTMFLVVTGDGWPEADEDELWQLAAGWAGVSDTVGVLEHQAMDPVRAVRRTDWDGPAAEAFAVSADVLAGHGGRQLDGLAGGARELSAFIYETGVNVQYMKVIVVGELLILQAQITWLVAMSPWTFGGSTAAVPALQVAGRSFALLAVRQLTMSIVVGQVMQVGLDASTQLVQLAAGTRKDWNTHLTTSAAVTGAVGVMVGLPLGVLGQAAGRALTSMVGKKVGEGLEHIVTNAVHEYATDVGTGFVTGRGFVHSPFSLTAGATEGAVDAAGGLLRGKRRGVGVPDVPDVPDVAVVGGVAKVGGDRDGASSQFLPLVDLFVRSAEAGPGIAGVPVSRVAPVTTGPVDDIGSQTQPLLVREQPVATPPASRMQDPLDGGPALFDGEVSGVVTSGGVAVSGRQSEPDGGSAGSVFRLGGGRSVYRMQAGSPAVVTGYVPVERRERLEVMHTAVDGRRAGAGPSTEPRDEIGPLTDTPGVLLSSWTGVIDQARPMAVTRKVSADGRVTLGSLPGNGLYQAPRTLQVGKGWAGRQVTVRFDQDGVAVIAGGVVVRSVGAVDLQLTPGEFAGLRGVSNTTDLQALARVDLDRSVAVTRKVSLNGVVALGNLPGDGLAGDRRRGVYVGRRWVGREAIVRFVQGQDVVRDRVVVIVGGVVVKSVDAADLQLTPGEFALLAGASNLEGVSSTDPLPVVQVSPVGSFVLGDQQDVAGTSAGVDRVVRGSSEGSPIRRALGEMTAFLFADTEDRDVDAGDVGDVAAGWLMDSPLPLPLPLPSPLPLPEAQVGGTGLDGPMIRDIVAGKRTARQADLDGDALRVDTVQRRVRPRDTEPAGPDRVGRAPTRDRINLDQPMVITRKVSVNGSVVLGSLPGNGPVRGRPRTLRVGMGWAGQQATVRFDQDGVAVIAGGVVVRSVDAADLQLTLDGFALLDGVSNTTDPRPPAAVDLDRPMVVTRRISAVGTVALGYQPGNGPARRRPRLIIVGKGWAGQQATVRFDQDGVVVIAGGVVVKSLAAVDLQLTPAEFARLNGVSNTVDPRPPDAVDLRPVVDPRRPMVVTRKVSLIGRTALGSLPGDGPARDRRRVLVVGMEWAGQEVTVRFVQGQDVAQDRVVIIVGGVVVKSVDAADLQLTPGEFALLGGASNLEGVSSTDPLPVVQVSPVGSFVLGDQQDVAGTSAGVDRVVRGSSEGSPIRRAVGEMTDFLFADTEDRDVDAGDVGDVAAGWLMDSPSPSPSPSPLPLPEAQVGGTGLDGPMIRDIVAGKRTARQADLDGDALRVDTVQRRVRPRDTEPAGPDRVGRAPTWDRINLDQPMVVTRKASPDGRVVLGSLPGNGPVRARARVFNVGRRWAGREVTVRFDRDEIVAIVGGKVVKPLDAVDLQLTPEGFAGLDGVSNTTDPRPPARVDLDRPMVVTRKVSSNGVVGLGSLSGDGPARRRPRLIVVGKGWAGQQATVRFDRDRVVAIVGGVVVKSVDAADLQLTPGEFALLGGASNLEGVSSTDSLPVVQVSPVGSFVLGDQQDVAGTSAGVDRVVRGSPEAQVGGTGLDGPMIRDIVAGKRTARQADLDGDALRVDTVQRRVRPRDTEPAGPDRVGRAPTRDRINLDQPMVVTRTVSVNGSVVLGRLPGNGSEQGGQRILHVGKGWAGRQATVRFDQEGVAAIVGGVVVKSVGAADLQLIPDGFARLDGVSNTTDPRPPARVDLDRPMVVTRKVSSVGNVVLGRLSGNGSEQGGQRILHVGRGWAGRQVTVRFEQDGVAVIVGGVVVKSVDAADLQLTPGEFARLDGASNTTDPRPPATVGLRPAANPDQPMVVTRKVLPNGRVGLGSLPSDGPAQRRPRLLAVGRRWVGREVTVRFDRDGVVAVIVDGTVVKSVDAADLQLTPNRFALLDGVNNIDPLPVAQAFPAGSVGPVGVVVAGPQQDVAGTSAGVGGVVQGLSEGSPIRRAVGEMTAFLFADTEDRDVDAGDVGDVAAGWLMDSPSPSPSPEAQVGGTGLDGPMIRDIVAGKRTARQADLDGDALRGAQGH